MYEAFYGFRAPPFLGVPDPRFLYLSPQHKRALSLLQYAAMSRAGFCVVTGDIGAGKTTLVRKLLEGLGENIVVGLVSNTSCESFEEFLRWILLAFGLEYRGKDKVELYDDLVRYLIEQHNAGRVVTLVIDEAQNLGLQNLEQLRMLSNVNTERGQILQTILVGQPELWDMLRQPELEQFSQRISYDYRLEPLDGAETTAAYIRHRLTVAGGSPDLFADETFPLIHEVTRGVPRLINLVCNAALVYGYAEEMRQIDCRIVHLVLKDKERSFAPLGREKPAPPPLPKTAGPQTATGSRAAVVNRSTIERAVHQKKRIID